MSGLRHSPLDAVHRAAGAKMAPFGGWEMPLSYRDHGTIAEHMACRQSAAVFDVSHLGTVRITGPDAFSTLQAEFTNDLAKVGPGQAQYTHLLDPHDASVIDDIIIWWLDDDVFEFMPNASNTDAVLNATGGHDISAERAVLAVQGPVARDRLSSFAPEAAGVRRFRVQSCDVLGEQCFVAGTGYTGEDGVEISMPVSHVEQVWSALINVGVVPAGLGARDTLRLEAGLPLHGHELGPGVTPLQAGLGWVVSWDKGDFRGRAALEAEREAGPTRRLRGLTVEGRRPPRQGQAIERAGEQVGVVTSGNFSPVLGHGIALGFLSPEVAVEAEVTIDVRGTDVPAVVAATPFVSR